MKLDNIAGLNQSGLPSNRREESRTGLSLVRRTGNPLRKFTVTASLLCLLVGPVAAQSQGSYRPGKPGAGANIEIITRTINDCENKTDRFVKTMRRAMSSSSLDGTAREDDLNRATKNLENSMDKVGDSWNRDKNVGKTRSYVRQALDNARNVNTTMRNRRLNNEVERDWAEVRGQLNLLARSFDLPALAW